VTVQDMINRVKTRTFQKDENKILGELQAAVDWAFNRIYNTENGADLLVVYAEEETLASRTREYDLAANLAQTVVGIKQLWLKFPTEVSFTPMQSADSTKLPFIFNDQWASSDTTTVAQGHPVLYDVINFGKVRFSPPLPADSVIRVDYWRKPTLADPTTNNSQEDLGSDLPFPVHEAVIDKATAAIFDLMDDTRAATWERNAQSRLQDALYLIQRRTSTPPEIKPFRTRRRGII
jgi:hypothetical protein